MNRFSSFVSRPEDLNCCFWDILLLLAGEPAFGFLREALSAPPGTPDEASSVDSLDRAFASFAETSEGGLEEAEDLPHAEETRDLPDPGKSREKRLGSLLGMRRKRRVPRGRDHFPSVFFLKLRACVLRANDEGWVFLPDACAKRFACFFLLPSSALARRGLEKNARGFSAACVFSRRWKIAGILLVV